MTSRAFSNVCYGLHSCICPAVINTNAYAGGPGPGARAREQDDALASPRIRSTKHKDMMEEEEDGEEEGLELVPTVPASENRP